MANLLLNIAARGAGAGLSVFGTAFTATFSSLTDNCVDRFKKGCVCPHPTECGCIGALCFYLGCQDHRAFNLIIEVHELDRLQKGTLLYIRAFTPRCQVVSQDIRTTGSNFVVEERLFVKIRQADPAVSLQILKKGVLKTEAIADYTLRVKEDLIDARFPKKRWLTLNALKGGTSIRALVSLHYMDPALPTAQSPLLQQAVLLAQEEAQAKHEPLQLDLANMGQKERLTFFAKVLEGPLQKMTESGGAWTDLYFRADETSKNNWKWNCWSSKQSCYSDGPVLASYSLLAISLVLPDKTDRNVFYVRYHEKHKKLDLFFKRVDRDRNLWCDGLFEFIEKLRSYLDLCASTDDVPSASAVRSSVKTKKKKNKSREASASALHPGDGALSTEKRRLSSPRIMAMTDASPKRPSAFASMTQNLMYHSDYAADTTQPDTPDEIK